MLPCWCILGLPASWLLDAEIATGSMVLRPLDWCHTIRCVRLPLDLSWLRWLYRWVSSYLLAVAASPKGRYCGRDPGCGRQLSSRNFRSLDHHGVISPVVRVSGCAQDDGVALVRDFDRKDRFNYPLPARSLSSNPLCTTSYSSSSVLARMVGPMGFVVVQTAWLLLRRKVAAAVGILTRRPSTLFAQ
jgi:hypothetical protein